MKSRGLIYVRTESSHEIWDRLDDSLLRPVTFRGAEKYIPGIHIHTNLITLGLTNKDFDDFIKSRHKKAKKK